MIRNVIASFPRHTTDVSIITGFSETSKSLFIIQSLHKLVPIDKFQPVADIIGIRQLIYGSAMSRLRIQSAELVIRIGR